MNPPISSRGLYVIAASMAAAALLLSVVMVFSGLSELNIFLAVVLILLGLAPIVRSVVRKSDYFEIINIFCFIFVAAMGVRGLTNKYQNSKWLVSYDIDSQAYEHVMLQVFIYGIVALATLYLGYWSKTGQRIAARIPRVRFFPNDKSKLIIIAMTALVVGILSSYVFLLEVGGTEVMADSTKMIEEGIEVGGRLYYSLFLEFAVIGLLFLYIGKMGMEKGMSEKALLALFGGLILFNYLMLPFKGQIIGIVLGVLVANNYLRKKIKINTLAVMMAVLILLLPFLNNYRIYGIDSLDQVWHSYDGEAGSTSEVNDITLGRSAGADMFFLALDRTPNPNPYLYGGSLMKIFTSFIPRPLYPDKPWSFGVDFSNSYLDTALKASTSPSTIGELYINFHVAGIIVGFFIIGIFLRTVYAYCISNGITREGVIIYAIIAEKTIVLVDGPLADYVVMVLIRLFPLVVLGLLAMVLRARCNRDNIISFS